MQTMATLTRFGTPAAIQIQTTNALPSAPAGMVRVRTEASSATFTDRLIRMGVYPDLKATPPFTLGYDCIGRVDQLGAGVTTWQVGQRVADLTVIGGNARYLIRPADSLIPVPESLDAAAAETMVLTFMSAIRCCTAVHKCKLDNGCWCMERRARWAMPSSNSLRSPNSTW